MFDRYVEERRKPGWYRRSLIGASIVTHSLVGLFLFAITLFTVDEMFGGWDKTQKRHFDDHGVFDEIYAPQ